MSLFRAKLNDSRSPIVRGLHNIFAAIFVEVGVPGFDNTSEYGPISATTTEVLSLAPFDNAHIFGPVATEQQLLVDPFDNVSEYGVVFISTDEPVAPFDNVSEYGPVEAVTTLTVTSFDNPHIFGPVTVDITVDLDVAPFDNVSEFGPVDAAVAISGTPFINLSEFGGVDIGIDVSVPAAPFDNGAFHDYGATEYCINAYPGTTTNAWDYAFVTATSGTETYADVFGATPSSGDLLLIVVHIQTDPVEPTITGFTKITPAVVNSTFGTTLLYARLADGTEGSTIAYSGWSGVSGSAWDFMRGLLIPAGEHYGTADSNTVVSSDHLDTATANPELDAGWGADVLTSFFCSIVTGGSTAPSVPSGYTSRVLQNFVQGATTRRTAIAEKQVVGSVEDPGEWATTGDKIVFAVRGAHGPCVYGGLSLDLPPFDNTSEFGPVVAASEGALYLTPFDNVSEYGPANVVVEQVLNLAPFNNISVYGAAAVEVFPAVFDSADTVNIEGGSHNATLPIASSGDFYVLTISYFAAIPTISGWTQEAAVAGGGGLPGLAVFTKIATGSEGATVAITLDAGDTSITHIMSLIGAGGSAVAAISTATNNPPNLACPNAPSMAFAVAAHRQGPDITAAPSGYTIVHSTSNEVGSALDMMTAKKLVDASSEDPGAFTSGAGSSDHVVATIVAIGA